MAFIGKNVIENLTTAMYENLMVVYREYVQNCADSIDKAMKQGLIGKNDAEIYIDIDNANRYISIEDNGTGICKDEFYKKMSSIADSTKVPSEDKGFRGIGRLGGISVCQRLRFSCSVKGEDIQSIVIWDAKKLRDILNDDTQNPDASDFVDEVTEYSIDSCDVDKHFFKVEMIDVEQSALELLDKNAVQNYLQSVAPLPYATGFIFASKIHDFAEKHNFVIDEYNIFVNSNRLFKEYRTRLYEDKNGQKVTYDEIVDVQFELFYADDDSELAWMWYGISRFEKAIPSINTMRGIRLRKGNIQIGNELTFSNHDFYKEPRGYLYFVGEVFALSRELRPNARRDYFNINNRCREFEHKLRDLFYNRFYTIYHLANQVKKAYQKKQELADTEGEFKAKVKDGFDSPESKEMLENKINDLKTAATKADKILETRTSKEKSDEVLNKVYTELERIYKSIPKEEPEDKLRSEGNEKLDDSINPYKNKVKYKSQSLSQYNKKEQKLIGKIYGIIRAILPNDMAEVVINKIQEELSK